MKIEMSITNDDVKISKSSIAEIQGMGVMGGREIAILNNFSDQNFTKSGDILKSSNSLGFTDKLAKEIVPVKQKVEVMLDDIDILVKGLNSTLDAQTRTKYSK